MINFAYSKIIGDEFRHYNKSGEVHSLIGPAIYHKSFSYQIYFIDGISYLYYYKYMNKIFIMEELLLLKDEYFVYIKQNIINLINLYNSNIALEFNFNLKKINQLPIFIKDLIIL